MNSTSVVQQQGYSGQVSSLQAIQATLCKLEPPPVDKLDPTNSDSADVGMPDEA